MNGVRLLILACGLLVAVRSQTVSNRGHNLIDLAVSPPDHLVRDRPFTGRFEWTHTHVTDGSMISAGKGRLLRDRSGRIRRDVESGSAVGNMSTIDDPVRNLFIVLLHEPRLATESVNQSRAGSNAEASESFASYVPITPDVRDKVPAQKSWEGLLCRVIPFASKGQIVGELWISNDLNVLVMEKIRFGDDEYDYKLTGISTKDVPEKEFQIPADYTRTDGDGS